MSERSLLIELTAKAQRIERLEKENKVLKEALKPFVIELHREISAENAQLGNANIRLPKSPMRKYMEAAEKALAKGVGE